MPKYKKRGPFGLPVPAFMAPLKQSPEAIVAVVGIIAAMITTLGALWVSFDASNDALSAQKVIFSDGKRDGAFNAYELRQNEFDTVITDLKEAAKQSSGYVNVDQAIEKIDRARVNVDRQKWQLYGKIKDAEIKALESLSRNMSDIRKAFVGVFRSSGSIASSPDGEGASAGNAASTSAQTPAAKTPTAIAPANGASSKADGDSSNASPYANPKYEKALAHLQTMVEIRDGLRMNLYMLFFADKDPIE